MGGDALADEETRQSNQHRLTMPSREREKKEKDLLALFSMFAYELRPTALLAALGTHEKIDPRRRLFRDADLGRALHQGLSRTAQKRSGSLVRRATRQAE